MEEAEKPQPEALGRQIRALARAADRAALATALPEGRPYASLVLLALDLDVTPLLLLSDLAEHSRNLAHDPRLALLIDGTAGLEDPLTGPRASLIGRAVPSSDRRLRARFIARHPSAEAYAGFADFKLYRVEPERAHFVAGFGRIRWVEAKDLRLTSDCSTLMEAEPGFIADFNRDGGAAAEKLLRRGAGWRMTGIDPEGADFRRKGETARLDFAAPVWDVVGIRAALKESSS